MARYQLLVFSNPTPGKEDEYNRWYDKQHLPDVLAVPGFVSCSRARLVPGHGSNSHRYLAIYDIEADDVGAAMADLTSRAGTDRMVMSDAIDMSSVAMNIFEVTTTA